MEDNNCVLYTVCRDAAVEECMHYDYLNIPVFRNGTGWERRAHTAHAQIVAIAAEISVLHTTMSVLLRRLCNIIVNAIWQGGNSCHLSLIWHWTL